MLILTRRPDETIRIGEEVAITILGIRGNQVRIGIDAPRSVPVHRQEIYTRIHAERDGPVPETSPRAMNLRLVSTTGEVREQRLDSGKGESR